MKLVIDSNIFAKVFINEADSQLAIDFLTRCVAEDVSLLAPTLFEYELLQIAIYYDYPVTQALEQLNLYKQFNLSLVAPTDKVWLQTEEMVKQGHKNSGFPSLYDSVYHSLAIKENCNFVTADKRHEAKTKQFKHIILLNNWESCWSNRSPAL